MKTSVKFGAAMLALAMTLLAGLGGTALLLTGLPALAAEPAAAGAGVGSEIWTWGLAAAAASTALAALGAGFAVAKVGTAAIEAFAQDRSCSAASHLRRSGRGHRHLRPDRFDSHPQPAGVMTGPVYIGDEISAAGWRLTGVRVSTPGPGRETEAFASARGRASLVLVSAAVAARIDAAALSTAAGALTPLMLVLPDPQGEVERPAWPAACARNWDWRDDAGTAHPGFARPRRRRPPCPVRRDRCPGRTAGRGCAGPGANRGAPARARSLCRGAGAAAVPPGRGTGRAADAAAPTRTAAGGRLAGHRLATPAAGAARALGRRRGAPAVGRRRRGRGRERAGAGRLAHRPRPGWPADERDALAARLPCGHGSGVEFTEHAGLGAGLRIVAGRNVVDATLAGLLADREAIGARLLGELGVAS